MSDYAALEEVQSWPGFDTSLDAAATARLISASSRWIDGHCRRHFWQVTEARVFQPTDYREFDLGEFNDLVSVTAVKTDDDRTGSFETTWSVSDYQLTPVNRSGPEPRPYTGIRSVGGRWWPLVLSSYWRQGLVEITGTWGWPAVPEMVKAVCCDVVARVSVNPMTVQSESIDGYSTSFVASAVTDWDRDRLQPYRFAVGVGIG